MAITCSGTESSSCSRRKSHGHGGIGGRMNRWSSWNSDGSCRRWTTSSSIAAGVAAVVVIAWTYHSGVGRRCWRANATRRGRTGNGGGCRTWWRESQSSGHDGWIVGWSWWMKHWSTGTAHVICWCPSAWIVSVQMIATRRTSGTATPAGSGRGCRQHTRGCSTGWTRIGEASTGSCRRNGNGCSSGRSSPAHIGQIIVMLLVSSRRTHISTSTSSSGIRISTVVMRRKILMVMMKHDALTDDPIFRLIYSRINLLKKQNKWMVEREC